MAASISNNPTHSTGIAALIQASNNKPPATETTTSIFGEDGFTFGDIIDIVNPLQHIPIVNNIYRKITGDTIAPAMEIAGGALFGGPIGAIASVVTTAYQSYMQNKSNGIDPDLPDVENESTAIASNTLQQPAKSIEGNDYLLAANPDIDKSISNHGSNVPMLNKPSGWILNSETFSKASSPDLPVNSHASINTVKNKYTYQPADGIVNLAYKNTESYSDVITSTNVPQKTIDIMIGATSGAG